MSVINVDIIVLINKEVSTTYITYYFPYLWPSFINKKNTHLKKKKAISFVDNHNIEDLEIFRLEHLFSKTQTSSILLVVIKNAKKCNYKLLRLYKIWLKQSVYLFTKLFILYSCKYLTSSTYYRILNVIQLDTLFRSFVKRR